MFLDDKGEEEEFVYETWHRVVTVSLVLTIILAAVTYPAWS